MVELNSLEEIKRKADSVLKSIESEVFFDHFGIKVPDEKSYDEICIEYGKKTNEVILSERRVATVTGDKYIFEILEPKNNESVNEVFCDHLSYRVPNYEELRSQYQEPIAEFDFGETKGFKVEIDGMLIEFRNDKLTESKVD